MITTEGHARVVIIADLHLRLLVGLPLSMLSSMPNWSRTRNSVAAAATRVSLLPDALDPTKVLTARVHDLRMRAQDYPLLNRPYGNPV